MKKLNNININLKFKPKKIFKKKIFFIIEK